MPYVIAIIAIVAIAGTSMNVASDLGAEFQSIDTIVKEFTSH